MKSNAASGIILAVIFSVTGWTHPREFKYKCSDIPPELLIHAKAVVRVEETGFSVSSARDAVMTVKYAVTILNENAIHLSYFIQYYDKFSRIHDISANVYDKNGYKVKNILFTDINDYGLFPGYSLYEDRRCKFIDPKYRIIPFTVEYTWKESYSGIIDYPDWDIYPDYNISVERSEFDISLASGMKLRYLTCNEDPDIKVVSIEKVNGRTWIATGIKALRKEPFSRPFNDLAMRIMLAPEKFELSGFPGNSSTWRDFGVWISDLNSGRDDLEEETKSMVRSLVAGMEDDREKTGILYDFLQNKTRYVSVQIGLGGWQPYNASIVDRLSYGDCKALANYMRSLLNAAGIKSYYTLVNAGENAGRLVTEFPSNQFNHVIICVPSLKDTLWLECTSQHTPPGYLGSFTDDRDVLVIQDSGGVITRTPAYKIQENAISTLARVIISGDGHGVAAITEHFKGLFYGDMFPVMFTDNENRKVKILQHISIPKFDLTAFTLTDIRSNPPECIQHLELKLNHYATLTSGKMILKLNLLHNSEAFPTLVSERKSDIFIQRSSTDIDTIIYVIPENFLISSVPQPAAIHSTFGDYSMWITVGNQTLTYVRTMNMKKGLYPKDTYADLVDFFEKVATMDDKKAVLTDKYSQAVVDP